MTRSITYLLALAATLTTHADATRTYYDSVAEINNGAYVITLPDNRQYIAVEARAAWDKLYTSEGTHQAYWGMTWTESSGKYAVKLQPGTTGLHTLAEERYVEVNLCRNDSTVATRRLTHGIARHNGANTLAVEFDNTGQCRIYAGDKDLRQVLDLTVGEMPGEISVVTNRTIAVEYLTVESELDIRSTLHGSMSCDDLSQYLSGPLTGAEGVWRYLDRENDSRYARPGGDYRIALVKNDKNGYDIIYLSGAKVSASQWECGMIKGRLSPTIFENQYDLWWVDAKFQPLQRDIHARIEQDAILILEFPLLHTVMRFSREPMDN